ncbi:potassium:proton antiporter [Alteromonas sp. MB-3u-76]|uniref:potassium:proton antiporter n=1 Tax=Alteromonas sp. MB-3u-76 TaxID=2058133 RepID=UPI0012FDD558|nr:potassium:proton antiporter [Alteromonas sp. MB-3u-76]
MELLIAISIAGILMVFATQHTAYFYSNLLKVQFAIAIEEELDALEHVISTHLEKAGYLQQTKVVQLALPSTSLASVAISQFGKEAANSCITFSYDQNSDGKVSTSPNEFFGFRLRDKAIEYRVAKRTCKQAYWQDATDSKDIQIDDFSVAASAFTSWGASYTVTIKASSRIMSSVKATKVFIVEVANVRQK